MQEFDYSNLTGRAPGPFVRLGSYISPGIRKVQAQIKPYAEAWQRQNTRALTGTEPLWVVLGDSMSQGIGASRYDRGWVGQLVLRYSASGTPYRVINLSQSGARFKDVSDTQLPALRALNLAPDLVTVMVGSNDMIREKYRRHALQDFDELLPLLPQGTIMANLLGNRSEQRIIDNLLLSIAAEGKLHIADMRRLPGGWRGKVAEDHFHPNDAGYTSIATVFHRAIEARKIRS